MLSFANNIHTTDGGTHEDGFKRALTRVMNEYARKYNKFHIFSHFSGYKKAGTALCSARPHILTCFLYFLFVKLFMRQ